MISRVEISIADRQLTCLNGNITTSLIDSIRSAFQLNLFEPVICKPSVFHQNFLWRWSSTTILEPRLQDALTDLIASSARGLTKLSIATKIESCTLVSAVGTALLPSKRTLSVNFVSSVCISTWEPLIEAKWFELLEGPFSQHSHSLFNLGCKVAYHKVISGLIKLAEKLLNLLSLSAKEYHSRNNKIIQLNLENASRKKSRTTRLSKIATH